MRWATAFFITRALLTTCGRNIFPDPNRSPTAFMPAMSGPSMTGSGRSAPRRAPPTRAAPASRPAQRPGPARAAAPVPAGPEGACDGVGRALGRLARLLHVLRDELRDAVD